MALSMANTWPLPALLTWALAWGLHVTLRNGYSSLWSLALPIAVGVLMSLLQQRIWRRLVTGLGFPLSWMLSSGLGGDAGGLSGSASWGWLVPLAVLFVIYPMKAWKDAPVFPTPADALNHLPEAAPLPPGARVLDVGCGAGHGLQALRQAYPLAEMHGIERSRPLAWWTQRRCPWSRIETGDMWAQSWSSFDLVYLFQRPETMPRAHEKARAQMKQGSWLVSLEFAVPEVTPTAIVEADENGRPVYLYRM
jgi:hypothetical protein